MEIVEKEREWGWLESLLEFWSLGALIIGGLVRNSVQHLLESALAWIEPSSRNWKVSQALSTILGIWVCDEIQLAVGREGTSVIKSDNTVKYITVSWAGTTAILISIRNAPLEREFGAKLTRFSHFATSSFVWIWKEKSPRVACLLACF